MFGSTYCCEQLFSKMKYTKSHLRSQLSDRHLNDILLLSTSSIDVTLDGASMSMEVDTGSARSIISESTYQKLWPHGKGQVLHSSKVVLRTYTGEKVRPKGSVNVEVVQGGMKLSSPCCGTRGWPCPRGLWLASSHRSAMALQCSEQGGYRGRILTPVQRWAWRVNRCWSESKHAGMLSAMVF